MKENITKADIVDTISKKTGITKLDTKAVLEGVLDTIIDVIAKGHKVEIRGFGVFHSKKRKARLARNPRTGDLVQLKERFAPLFKSSGEFTKRVNAVRFPENQVVPDSDNNTNDNQSVSVIPEISNTF